MTPPMFPVNGQYQQMVSCGYDPSQQQHTHMLPPPNVTIPSKRPVVEDDDELQFLSEKPVKKRRQSAIQPIPPVQSQVIPPVTLPPVVPYIPMVPAQPHANLDTNDPRDRRISCGMVALPSDFNAMELTYALRGVSMPVLENFTLNQPYHQPRPSSPELSPKQLPSTISPTMLNVQHKHLSISRNFPRIMEHGRSNLSGCQQAEKPSPCPELMEKHTHQHDNPMKENLGGPKNTTRTESPDSITMPYTESVFMPPRTPIAYSGTPQEQRSKDSDTVLHEHNTHQDDRANAQKQSCQICSKSRHPAPISRQPGMSMMNSHYHSHMLPPIHYARPYGPHLHPQMLTMPTSNMHPYGPGYAPIMMPMGTNPYAALPTQMTAQIPAQIPTQESAQFSQMATPASPQKPSPRPTPTAAPVPDTALSQPVIAQAAPAQPQTQPEADKSKQKETNKPEQPQSEPSETAPEPVPAAMPSSDAVDPPPAKPISPVKPPVSLIQHTYRKHSPNLIVDIAETCQEIFPFEEVAKRHNAPVGKVFDVFAAIIQVPLLRCPTDRRRAGRLATARVKEYTKAKKDLQEAGKKEKEMAKEGERGGKGGGDKEKKKSVTPTAVAEKLGQVEFPEGFTLDGK
ncbi:hypothetical protein GGR57DRAFT_430092 [Xylariaceae sp. FL1272]|nr:hypothetical protein GGR57DRAFT_430092 [Xylariaceae sp. FL1272]